MDYVGMDTAGMVLGIIAVFLSIIVAIIFGLKNLSAQERARRVQEEANELQKQVMRAQAKERFIDWQDVEMYVSILAKQIEQDGFSPDYIIAPQAHDAVIANLIKQRLDLPEVPTLVGTFGWNSERDWEGFDIIPVFSRKEGNRNALPISSFLISFLSHRQAKYS